MSLFSHAVKKKTFFLVLNSELKCLSGREKIKSSHSHTHTHFKICTSPQQFPVWPQQRQCLFGKVWLKCALGEIQCLHHPLDETGVQVNDEHSQEGHLFTCVLEDDPRVVRMASEAVGSHHHGQVVHVHLGYGDVGRLGKYLVMIMMVVLEEGMRKAPAVCWLTFNL